MSTRTGRRRKLIPHYPLLHDHWYFYHAHIECRMLRWLRESTRLCVGWVKSWQECGCWNTRLCPCRVLQAVILVFETVGLFQISEIESGGDCELWQDELWESGIRPLQAELHERVPMVEHACANLETEVQRAQRQVAILPAHTPWLFILGGNITDYIHDICMMHVSMLIYGNP